MESDATPKIDLLMCQSLNLFSSSTCTTTLSVDGCISLDSTAASLWIRRFASSTKKRQRKNTTLKKTWKNPWKFSSICYKVQFSTTWLPTFSSNSTHGFVSFCLVPLPPFWKDQHCKAFALEHHHQQKLLLWSVLLGGAKGRRAATTTSELRQKWKLQSCNCSLGRTSWCQATHEWYNRWTAVRWGDNRKIKITVHGSKNQSKTNFEEWTCLRWGQKQQHDWSRGKFWTFQNLHLQMSSENPLLIPWNYWVEKKNRNSDIMTSLKPQPKATVVEYLVFGLKKSLDVTLSDQASKWRFRFCSLRKVSFPPSTGEICSS